MSHYDARNDSLIWVSPTPNTVGRSRTMSRFVDGILTSLCGDQYNVCVTWDYNCANDYPAVYVARTPEFPFGAVTVLVAVGLVVVLTRPRMNRAHERRSPAR